MEGSKRPKLNLSLSQKRKQETKISATESPPIKKYPPNGDNVQSGLQENKKPKMVEKRAGQRKGVKPHKRSPVPAVLIVDASTPNRKRPFEDSNGDDLPPPKKKKKLRCTKKDKHLCDVCVLPDCGKCSNCLNRSKRHQACKEKPLEKCRRWLQQQEKAKDVISVQTDSERKDKKMEKPASTNLESTFQNLISDSSANDKITGFNAKEVNNTAIKCGSTSDDPFPDINDKLPILQNYNAFPILGDYISLQNSSMPLSTSEEANEMFDAFAIQQNSVQQVPLLQSPSVDSMLQLTPSEKIGEILLPTSVATATKSEKQVSILQSTSTVDEFLPSVPVERPANIIEQMNSLPQSTGAQLMASTTPLSSASSGKASNDASRKKPRSANKVSTTTKKPRSANKVSTTATTSCKKQNQKQKQKSSPTSVKTGDCGQPSLIPDISTPIATATKTEKQVSIQTTREVIIVDEFLPSVPVVRPANITEQTNSLSQSTDAQSMASMIPLPSGKASNDASRKKPRSANKVSTTANTSRKKQNQKQKQKSSPTSAKTGDCGQPSLIPGISTPIATATKTEKQVSIQTTREVIIVDEFLPSVPVVRPANIIEQTNSLPQSTDAQSMASMIPLSSGKASNDASRKKPRSANKVSTTANTSRKKQNQKQKQKSSPTSVKTGDCGQPSLIPAASNYDNARQGHTLSQPIDLLTAGGGQPFQLGNQSHSGKQSDRPKTPGNQHGGPDGVISPAVTTPTVLTPSLIPGASNYDTARQDHTLSQPISLLTAGGGQPIFHLGEQFHLTKQSVRPKTPGNQHGCPDGETIPTAHTIGATLSSQAGQAGVIGTQMHLNAPHPAQETVTRTQVHPSAPHPAQETVTRTQMHPSAPHPAQETVTRTQMHPSAPHPAQETVTRTQMHPSAPYPAQETSAISAVSVSVDCSKQALASKKIAESSTSEDEIEAVFQAGVANGTVKLHITKCGVSGPPDTGKSHVRALMLGKERPSERRSTALATDADQVTPDYKRFSDEDLVDISDKGYMWRVIKKDSMARIIANTLHNQEYSTKNNDAESTVEDHASSEQSFHRPTVRQKFKMIMEVKKHLNRMKGKPKRKRKGLNGIHLVFFVDTGGQPQFQEILPNFIKCDVNLLVHNLSQSLEHCPDFNYVAEGRLYTVPERMKMSNISIIEQSVRSITSSIVSADRNPHVAIVGTFKDKCDPATFSEMIQVKSQKINEKLKPYIGTSTGKCNVFSSHRSSERKIFAIDGSESGWEQNGDTLETLKHRILECSKKRPIEVPIKYFIFLQNLLERAEKNNLQYVTLEDCKSVAAESVISMDTSDIHEALKLFNDCNVISYFPEILENIVFIKPGFLFGKVTDLIVASFQCESDIMPVSRANFQKTGSFDCYILDGIKLPNGQFTKSEFIKLLKGLFIIAEISLGRYFMPCVLPPIESANEELQDFRKCMEDSGIDGPFIISFCNKMSPRGLFCSLLVALAGNPKWKLKDLEKDLFRRRNSVEFEFGDDKVAIVDRNSHLEVYTTCEKQNCPSIREMVCKALDDSCDNMYYNHEHLYTVGFTCTICEHQEFHSSEVKSEKNGWKERCSLNRRKRAAILAAERAVWFEDYADAEFLQKLCDEVATETDEWEKIAISLFIEQSDIDLIYEECHEVDRCFPKVFETWRKQGKLPFTWETIISVLRSNYVGEDTLANSLERKYCK